MSLNAYTATVGYGASSGGSFTTITTVRDINPPQYTASLSDVTHLNSPNFAREFIPSWRTPGDAGFVFQWSHSVYASLKVIWDARTLYYFKITFPVEGVETNPSVLLFQARISGMEIQNMKVGDEPILVNVKFACVAGFTFTEGS